MFDPTTITTTLAKLNALAGGLFLLAAFALVATRQVLACLRIYIGQSVLLAISAILLGAMAGSVHLFIVAAITLAIKSFLIPRLLRSTVGEGIYARREISQILNVQTSLLIAVAIAFLAYAVATPLLAVSPEPYASINLPIGMAGLFLGAYTICVRREAVPQLIGILAMENGAFFAGVSIAPGLPLIAELAAAFDVLIIALVMGLLTRKIHEYMGTTAVGEMTSLREE
jgi:hydrogenase-4 component E